MVQVVGAAASPIAATSSSFVQLRPSIPHAPSLDRRVRRRSAQRDPVDARGLRGVVEALLDLVRPFVLESANGAGCAVAAACTESHAGSALRLASRDALRSWRERLSERLLEAGAAPREASELASLLLATLEGAHVLCRAEGSIEPFDAAVAALRHRARAIGSRRA